MDNLSSKKFNIRIALLNVCPFLIIGILFFFPGFINIFLTIPTLIWISVINYRALEKTHLFIIIQTIMLFSIAVSNSINAIMYHYIMSDDYETLYVCQVLTQAEIAFLIIITIISSIIKALLKRKRSKIIPKFEIDYPCFSITPNTVEFISALKASPIEHKFVTNGYVTFEGKAFGSDVPLIFGVHFNSLKIEFIEIFRPKEYYQSPDYDISKSFSQLSEILKRQYGDPLTSAVDSITGNPSEKWQTQVYAVEHYIIDRFESEEHLHIKFTKHKTFYKK